MVVWRSPPEGLARFFDVVLPHMNEVQRRVVAGAAAEMLGRGGKTAVAAASGMSRNTVIKAEAEVVAGIEPSVVCVRRAVVTSRWSTSSPGCWRRWTSWCIPRPGVIRCRCCAGRRSRRPSWPTNWSRQGFEVSARTVLRLLHRLGYSLQANAKVIEGRQHPDRDAQFRYLNDMAPGFIDDGQPAISVDTKKKELIGDYANGGAEWAPAGEPERVERARLRRPRLGRVRQGHPLWDLRPGQRRGLGQRRRLADTAEFAVNSIRGWWNQMGRARFPDADRLLITADAGGSNGYRVRAWKVELARLAAETGLEITVCHYPPGTSKWNRIEHRMFSFITMNWRGTPLTCLRTIIELISATTTTTGLSIQAAYDPELVSHRRKDHRRRARRRSPRRPMTSTANGTTPSAQSNLA